MNDLRSRLKKLANTESTYPHILSAYFSPRQGSRDRRKEVKIFIKNRVAEITSVLSGDDRAKIMLRREIDTLEHIIDQEVPQTTNGLAVFIRGGEVFERFDASFAFENQLAYRRVPHIAQLAFMSEELEPFAIVTLDSKHARIFDMALGVVSDPKAQVESEVHRRIHSGGWSQTRYQRHIDHQKREHIDDVVKQLTALVARFNYKRIMLVGPAASTSRLLELLPKNVSSRVIERKALMSRASDNQIVEEALRYFTEAENAEEAEKVRRVRVEIHSSGMAVAGVDNVVRCVNHGKVHELLMAADLDVKGEECTECGAIVTGRGHSTCPSCDAPKDRLKDVELREVLTRKSLQYGFKLEFVKNGEMKGALGGIAALLHSPNT
ncbi:MAG: hypothetical protein L6Q71_04375 [Planctomycetes bacterium]|nr:hypothetical protein [Planctomycetota bacterium]NUQ33708.1 hypothetical protein [Planctomycetaceae bacterium]